MLSIPYLGHQLLRIHVIHPNVTVLACGGKDTATGVDVHCEQLILGVFLVIIHIFALFERMLFGIAISGD